MEDEDTIQPCKAVPKKASHIIELADGSEDNNNKDMPGLAPVDDEDNEDKKEDEEAPAKSVEAELSAHSTNICQKLS